MNIHEVITNKCNAMSATVDKVASDYATRWGCEYAGDVSDLRQVAAHIKKGNIKKACDAARNMDTIVREVIPNDVWDFLESNA